MFIKYPLKVAVTDFFSGRERRTQNTRNGLANLFYLITKLKQTTG